MMLRLRNGSVWRVVGADNPDSLVGANPVGVVLSEYALMDANVFDYISPILSENDGWAIFITTPRGKNHAYRLHERAKAEMRKGSTRWWAQTLTVEDTHAIPEAELEEEKARMSPELFQQEYYCATTAPLDGAYYGELIVKMEREKRIGNVPYDPARPVSTSWDLGQSDDNPIVFWQQVGREVRMIDCHEANGKGFDYYSKVLKDKPYAYDYHYAPHDINVREFSGQSRIQIAAAHGIRFSIVPKLSLQDGINAVRMLLPRTWIDEGKCGRVVQALREYSRTRDPHTEEFGNIPKRNWAIHLADAVRYFAVGVKPERNATPLRLPSLPYV